MKKFLINNLNFIVGRRNEITNFIIKQINNNKGFILLPTDLNSVASVDKNHRLKKSFQMIDFCVTDGMPLVWFFRLRNLFYGEKNIVERVYGPFLMRDVLKNNNKKNRHFFYGSSDQTLKNLRKNIYKMTPAIKIVGMISPPFRKITPKEEARYIKKIIKSKANVLWIGLSSPKQVVVATRWLRFMPKVSIMCVGAAFDLLADKTTMAPKIFQRFGLEWLFRLFNEPKRLWKRYLVVIPIFIIKKIYHYFFK